MNRKDRLNIAKIWAAGILMATDATSFQIDGDIKENDQDKIVEEVHNIARKLLKERPLLVSLPDILDHVLGPIE